ncbi:hypothetical protein ACOT81_36550 [Streptomyces sp. WI04-05B]|uniref:hypothetical protein n=1 Tax=Streptomyces TaxID=1883 RepID=UPI0029BEAD5E|nr:MULTISPECIES: hypothetical protein [unclassified Streptomyces]MDX2546287.1 hypothetical protein [Streptomyces sp. WI04-05B]MDX2589260.1 hypothetical protein [Streptomyces sp. WI04-05A]
MQSVPGVQAGIVVSTRAGLLDDGLQPGEAYVVPVALDEVRMRVRRGAGPRRRATQGPASTLRAGPGYAAGAVP